MYNYYQRRLTKVLQSILKTVCESRPYSIKSILQTPITKTIYESYNKKLESIKSKFISSSTYNSLRLQLFNRTCNASKSFAERSSWLIVKPPERTLWMLMWPLLVNNDPFVPYECCNFIFNQPSYSTLFWNKNRK